MKKNTLLYLILFILLAGFAVYLLITRSNTTVKGVYKDFAVKDTAAITKIFIADRANNTLMLERKGVGYWTANGKYKADNRRVNQLLECIRNVEMRSPVPKAMMDYVIKSMAANNLKTEIYQGDKLVKTYYVGGNTQDELGTYMLMENSTEPFAMWLPYFHGYLNIRYVPQVADWRDKAIFTIPATDIQSVVETYPSMPDSSYSFSVAINVFTVSSPSQPSKSPIKVEGPRGKGFLMSFKDDYFEQAIKATPQATDSISKAATYADLVITSANGKKEELRLIPKRADQGTKIETKDLLDAEKFYGILNGDKNNLVMLQRDAIKNCLGTFKDFK